MRTLLDLLLISALISVVGSVSVALLIRHAVRRLRRAARVWLAAARLNRPLSVASQPSGRQPATWNSSAFRTLGERVTTRPFGPALSARTHLPGAAAAVARVRRDLHRDVTATSHALRAARRAGRPVDGLDSSVAALVEQAQGVQLDLRIITAEPDRRVGAQMLAAQIARANLIQRTCAQVRTALLKERSGGHESALQRIVEDIDDAVTAASFRARAYRELSGR